MADAANQVQGNQSSQSIALTSVNAKSRLALIRQETNAVIRTMSADQLADIEYVEYTVLEAVHSVIAMVNAPREKSDKFRHITELLPAQIADIIAYSHPVVRIATGGFAANEECDILAMYQRDGEDVGLYSTDSVMFSTLIRRYNYAINMREIAEVLNALRDKVPRVLLCEESNLVPVNNGIFDYNTKQLLPFDEAFVFLTKSRVNYNPNVVNPVIVHPTDGSSWDVESWMSDLSDDQEVVNVLWEILGAIIRPLVPWNLSAWFYSETGNNGKGTLCELMRQLCGEGAHTAISLENFSKDFMLAPLLYTSAIIVDENDVGTFIDKAARLKAVITGDTLTIDRKFKSPITFSFRGFMVQCLNEMPRIRDKSDSFYRRQLFVPFDKCFTGVERKYIKEDYLRRVDVLEYVLHRVLHMDYYKLSIPKSCTAALQEYKEYVDPVRQFLAEMLPRFKWDLIPSGFLYALYCAWYKRNAGSDRNLKGSASFLKDVRTLLAAEYSSWTATDKTSVVRTGSRMNNAEPLILEYDLEDWKNPRAKNSTDVEVVCHPNVAVMYRGIYRVKPQGCSDEDIAAKTGQISANMID